MFNRSKAISSAALGLLALISGGAARAHFLWAELTPGAAPAGAIRFSEKPGEETAPPLLEKIKAARIISSDGKALETKPGTGVLRVSLPEGGRLLGASQKWGVVDRGPQGGAVYLLQYYAKAAVDPKSAGERAGLHFEVFAQKSGDEWVARVMHGSRPELGAELTILTPGREEPLTMKTDSRGEARFKLAGAGICAIRAMAVEDEAGEFEGKAYKLKRYYSTLTFRSPGD